MPERKASVGDPLSPLHVVERLEVGPARIEPNRLTVPYRVWAGDEVDETELAYRWEQDVFDPSDEGDRALASMIGVQVALNYGLFCDEIVLHGPFDAADRKFLEEMAANTAREIFVHKFLRDNPFIRGAAADLPAVRRESYLRSRLVFPDARDGEVAKRRASRGSAQGWAADPGRVAVLSSGGKDSLLSYGLLSEMGLETHSIFVNESGRHWFTARNAFRHLRATTPATTTRVWTSSDRVFSWMLRHLPFVRPDHARLRSDEYPIRLWTVAVFLFGALPELRARGIGRLVIGDEYDTTRRMRFKGITHYDGLYDQSRFFDRALTRYYKSKGWPLEQFSLLRQMSELLIQKTLAERYPELLRHQVSCHAASIEDERTRPCGRCEKCRRIVGMLLAVGTDPHLCGYTREQVQGSVEALAARGVHQETAAVRQLAWMLAAREVLPARTDGLGRGQERSEILKLRFDPTASPLDTVPADLRPALHELLLQHAAGAVEKTGRIWSPSSPDRGPAPADDEEEAAATTAPAVEAAAARPYLLGELTWQQARVRFGETDIVLLPVGAIEQHGPHLPLDIDSWDADYTCREVAARCSDPKPLVLPLVPYGVSYHHDDFPGTLSVGPDTLARFVYEIGMAAARHGVKKLVIVNGHGGNAPALQLAAQMVNRDARIFTCVDTGETSDAEVGALAKTRNDVHAGEIETSTALASRPHLVDRSRLEPATPEFSSRYLDFSSASRVEWYEHTAKISESGVLGDPTQASREKGEQMWRAMIDHLVRFVEALKDLTLDEIVSKRH